jgi:UDP-arabinose 4-epimerase
MKVVVAGGAGYIGSHACKAIAARGWTPVVVDNLSTGSREAVRWGELRQVDIRDTDRLASAMKAIGPDAVVHFAGSAYVGESTRRPLDYYDNNVGGTLSLVRACVAAGVSRVVFSSSCNVYGLPEVVPIDESTPRIPINPYGETKLACERLLHWAGEAHGIGWIALRYFNAAGGDPDGEVGETHDPETHLIPLALKAAGGRGPVLRVFGDDYPTPDGTAIRDYVHVTDLADAHVAAIALLGSGASSQAINLGAGRGHSVKEVIRAVEEVTGLPVARVMSPRREGDAPDLRANATLARRLLGWNPRHSDLEHIVSTAWSWERRTAARIAPTTI